MINNNVDFTRDPSDYMYIATIKIVNKQLYSSGEQQSVQGNGHDQKQPSKGFKPSRQLASKIQKETGQKQSANGRITSKLPLASGSRAKPNGYPKDVSPSTILKSQQNEMTKCKLIRMNNSVNS